MIFYLNSYNCYTIWWATLRTLKESREKHKPWREEFHQNLVLIERTAQWTPRHQIMVQLLCSLLLIFLLKLWILTEIIFRHTNRSNQWIPGESMAEGSLMKVMIVILLVTKRPIKLEARKLIRARRKFRSLITSRLCCKKKN